MAEAAAAVDTDIKVSCTSEYPDYFYNASHDIWTLVTLQAPCQEEEEEDDPNKRAPIDIVAVLDKSGSMAGEKLELVKKTMEFVLTQLSPEDRLSLVTYDTNVTLNFRFMNMTKENKASALEKIRAIRDGSSTNLSGGLMKGLVQVIERTADTKNDVASVLLFTDGLANHGITSANGIIAAMKDPKKFDGPSDGPGSRSRGPPMMTQCAPPSNRAPQAPPAKAPTKKKMMKKAGPPPPPPPPEVEPEPEPEKPTGDGQPADASVYTFGFGEDHDPELLKKIADAGNGMYYFIETEDKIAESFAHCLGGLMSTVAQGIQLHVTTEEGVTIKEVHCARPHEKTGDQTIKVNMGDLQSEEGRDVVLELTLAAVTDPYVENPQPVFKVNVDYFNVLTNNLGNADSHLGVLRPADEGAHDEASLNPKVTKEKCRVGMTRAMKDADKKANQGDYDGVKQLLNSQIAKMKSCKELVVKFHPDAAMEEEYDAMADDLEECRINSENASQYQSKGRKMQMNKMQMYDCQRSSESTAKAFKTKKKAGMVMKSRAYHGEEE